MRRAIAAAAAGGILALVAWRGHQAARMTRAAADAYSGAVAAMAAAPRPPEPDPAEPWIHATAELLYRAGVRVRR